MRSILTFTIAMIFSFLYSTANAQNVFSTNSTFHSTISDINPPYECQVKLRAATGVGIGLDTKHSYKFSGICSVKLPYGNSWIYQDLWVEINATWDSDSRTATEDTEVQGGDGNRGSINLVLRCDSDPWLTKEPCVVDTLINNTNFTNFGKVFNPRNGLYPPFTLLRGQFPPLARNQALFQDALALSIAALEQEVARSTQAFAQTFPNVISQPLLPRIRKSACKPRKVVKKPKVKVVTCEPPPVSSDYEVMW